MSLVALEKEFEYIELLNNADKNNVDYLELITGSCEKHIADNIKRKVEMLINQELQTVNLNEIKCNMEIILKFKTGTIKEKEDIVEQCAKDGNKTILEYVKKNYGMEPQTRAERLLDKICQKGYSYAPHLISSPGISLSYLERLSARPHGSHVFHIYQRRKHQIRLTYVFQNPNLTLEFLENNIHIIQNWRNINWSNLSTLTEVFVEKYVDKNWNWPILLYHPNLSLDFINKLLGVGEYKQSMISNQLIVDHCIRYPLLLKRKDKNATKKMKLFENNNKQFSTSKECYEKHIKEYFDKIKDQITDTENDLVIENIITRLFEFLSHDDILTDELAGEIEKRILQGVEVLEQYYTVSEDE